MTFPRVYLAGPDVFFQDHVRVFDDLKQLCHRHGLLGVTPGDGGLSSDPTLAGDELAERIYQANVALIRGCDAVLANLMPFRNALEPDSGTVFEVGFAIALGKPVAAYNVRGLHETRIETQCGKQMINGLPYDKTHGFLIESMGQSLNLMLSRSCSLHETAQEAAAAVAQALATGSQR